MDNKNAIKGGEFIVRETLPEEIFIPEDFTEEPRMIAQTCQDFLDTEVIPNLDRLDAHEEGLMPNLLKKAGELGLLGISIPEEYEGFGQNFTTSMLVADVLGAGYSFSVGYSADTGIGTLPIMYYGNKTQKQKYLPKLASGEFLGAYCLTEPGAGSDANSGKTKAVLNEAGTHYILNGSKMWITNGGFADILTVFAKIDDDRILSAFIVERNFPGITFGAEENKMGIKGSSTVQIFFNDCEVPIENLLGKRGDGFRIALNILNLGRIKLGANVIGASKTAINQSVQYANERKQFRTLIANFPAIKYKLAQQVIKAFANETAVYRMSKNVDDAVKRNIAGGTDKGQANVEAQREFVIEAALIKVFGSEMLDYVVDEGVQIHGGMGFSAETAIERGYRDSRINRIFEGTNEINRMLIVDMTLKKAMKGTLDLMGPATKVANELMSIPDFGSGDESELELLHKYVKNFKKAVLMVAG
ncbi:MAG: acyl-CoA dehydrogenase family protein [Bacteroidales bacterium]|nr:acyl-CoA dehydrogenase family protein [Bacteroidales bacterium]